MDEDRFWTMIEQAWRSVGGVLEARQALAAGKLSDERAEELVDLCGGVIQALQAELRKLPADELMAFDRILERKLYEIDRADVHEHIEGSDDGFLYALGFIVAAGKAYYDAVSANPSLAPMMDLECEEMCYLSWHLYQDKFGEMPRSSISRESCSNQAGWQEEG